MLRHHARGGERQEGLGPARRRRRAVIVGAVAATVAVLVVGGLAVRALFPGAGSGDDQLTGSTAGLSVSIAYPPDRAGDRDPNPYGASHDNAVWDPKASVVYYVSGLGYSGTCPPTGAARRSGNGSLALRLVDYHGGGSCTSDARAVVAAIHGVSHRPATLTVTDLGETRHIAVAVAGTRLVGVGRVTVSVPAAWADDAESCNTPFEDTAFFPWPQDCLMARQPLVSSVVITSGEFTETGTHLADLHGAGRLGEQRVVESDTSCQHYSSPPGRGGDTRCTQTFGVPGLHAFFTAAMVGEDARARLAAVRGSLAVLPHGQTTVPFLAPATSVHEVLRTLRDAGLTALTVRESCAPSDTCMAGVVSTAPSAGAVVDFGSGVRVGVHPATHRRPAP